MIFDLDNDHIESNNLVQQQMEKESSLQKAYRQWETQMKGAAFPYMGTWKKKKPNDQSKKKNKTKTKKKK